MRGWRGIIRWTELGTPAAHIAQQVHDALVRFSCSQSGPGNALLTPSWQTDLWMQPCYTVGVDALLWQMVRDFVPEPVYEWAVGKAMM